MAPVSHKLLRLSQMFSGCGATRNFDGGIAKDEIGWP
jgi:hypothetical protein